MRRVLLWFGLAGAFYPACAPAAELQVSIQGLASEARLNAEAATGIVRAARQKPDPRQIRALHNQAPGEIERSLRTLGFYKARVTGRLEEQGSRWRATYVVDPGPPLLVGRTDLGISGAGEGDPELLSIANDFDLKPGDTLRHDRYESGKARLLNRAVSRGYLDAHYDSSAVLVALGPYSCELVLHLDTGPRYFFGPVTIRQNIVDTQLLVGYIPFQPGDTVDLLKLRELQDNLLEAVYFSQAYVELKREAADGLEVPVQVDLVPRKRRRFEFGLGYGTDTGIRGHLEAQFRRLNRRGHNASLRLEASEIERSLSAQYRIPPFYPQTAHWTLSAGYGDFSPDWSQTKVTRLGLDRSQHLLGFRVVFGFSLEAEIFEIAGVEDSSFLSVWATEFERLATDDIRMPSRGSRLSLRTRGSHDAVLSTATFLQSEIDTKWIRTLFRPVRILARASAGYVTSTDFFGLPPTARFVTGGSQSVRGYTYQTLGPRDAEGRVVGGRVLSTASVELDWMFIRGLGRWGLAAFADFGNAASGFDRFAFEAGAGGGLRWSSPVGMLRLDLAWPISRNQPKPLVYFSMGPEL